MAAADGNQDTGNAAGGQAGGEVDSDPLSTLASAAITAATKTEPVDDKKVRTEVMSP